MQTFIEIPFQGQTLRGMKHVPDNGGAKCPAVIFFHGFTGNRIEGHRLFYQLSCALERAGIASVRFDFLGSGESDGDYAAMTLPLLVDQAVHALQWMEAELSPQETYVIGFSLGGLVASLVTEKCVSVTRTVLISPGRARRILERDKHLYANAQDEVIDVSGNRVGREYYSTLGAYVDQPKHFHPHQRVLVLHGTADAATPMEFGRDYLSVSGGEKTFVEVPKADHGYSSLPLQQLLMEQVIRFLGV